MQKDLSDYRKSYNKGALLEDQIPANPYALFDNWLEMAKASDEIEEPNTMHLSTIGPDGFPKSRVVLLKQVEDGDFLFYTNYTSEKAKSIDGNPQVSLNFFWPALQRQCIVIGKAVKVDRERSESYFHSRPRGSQIGAWASNQSSEVPSREYLDKQIEKYEKKFEGQEVPLPDFWGGFAVKPVSFEFWQGRENRMHDRILYTPAESGWKTKRLAP